MADKSEASVQAAWAKLVAKAWSDEAFKQRLLKDPTAVAKEAGLDLPGGMALKVVEDTDKLVHFVLPSPPASGELSDEDLQKMAGGYNCKLCTCVIGPIFCGR